MIFRLLICIFCAGLTLYAYIDRQNSLTELRIAIPALAKRVKQIHMENRRLQYEIEHVMSPEHLLKLADQPEYSHLHFPSEDEVTVIPLQEKPAVFPFFIS
jgi:hypothetical protein